MNFIHTPGANNFTEIMAIHTLGALLINFIRIRQQRFRIFEGCQIFDIEIETN